jgi:hypothetical protein
MTITLKCEKSDPKCPADAYINFDFTEQLTTLAVRTCPEFRYFNYNIDTNMDRVEEFLPPECANGTCKVPTPTTDTTYQGKVKGYCSVQGQELFCGEASDTFVVQGCEECTPCVDQALNVQEFVSGLSNDVYTLKFNNTLQATLNVNNTIVSIPPNHQFSWQVDCEETLNWDVQMFDDKCGVPVLCASDSGSFDGPCDSPCEDVTMGGHSAGLQCHDVISGGEAAECSHFFPGSVPLMKLEGPNQQTTAIANAIGVLTKGGACDAGRSGHRYWLYWDVKIGDPIAGDSHQTYCVCPPID